MRNPILITQRQTPTFRAAIKSGGNWFVAATDLATQEELDAEGIDRAPITYTVYRSLNETAPYHYDTAKAEAITGYIEESIDEEAFIDAETIEEQGLDYCFQFTPAARASFPFEKAGNYFIDFLVYPKTGAAISWRVGVEVG